MSLRQHPDQGVRGSSCRPLGLIRLMCVIRRWLFPIGCSSLEGVGSCPIAVRFKCCIVPDACGISATVPAKHS
eukprot:5574443-Pyramimonas_sp.AAC.1